MKEPEEMPKLRNVLLLGGALVVFVAIGLFYMFKHETYKIPYRPDVAFVVCSQPVPLPESNKMGRIKLCSTDHKEYEALVDLPCAYKEGDSVQPFSIVIPPRDPNTPVLNAAQLQVPPK